MSDGNALAGIRALLSIAYRASRWRTIVAFTPFFALAVGAGALATRRLLDSLGSDDDAAIVVAVVVFTAAWGVATVATRRSFVTRVQLGDEMGYELDRRVLEAASSIVSVEPFERPELLDRLEVIRSRREELLQFPTNAGYFIDGTGGVLMSIVLLVIVAPELAFVPIAGIPALILGRWGQQRVDQAAGADAETSRLALHYFDVGTSPTAAKELRIFRLRDELLRRFSQQWRASDERLFRADETAAAARSIGIIIASAVFLVAVAIVANAVDRGDMSPGDVFVVLAVLTAIVGQLSGVSGGVGNVRRAVDVARRLAWVLDRGAADTAEQKARAGQVPERLVDGIRLSGVRFTYAGASEPALHDLDLHLPAGSVVAIVGDNGAGKTTLLKLLFGFYEPHEGTITIDGTPLPTVDIEAWRARTSACFQDYANPHFVAREVVGIGDLPRIDDGGAITAAATRARAADVLETLPDGLETQLGSTFQGRELSGGQWQKLAIGRAMLRDEPLLLALDEPTSALDPLAEHELFEAYAVEARARAERNGAITVLISHRFSTVRIADLIVVVDDGTIREQGTHAELMAADGMYAELYTLQARHYR